MAELNLSCRIAVDDVEYISMDFVEVERDGKTFSLSCNRNSDIELDSERFRCCYEGVDISGDGDECEELGEVHLEALKGARITCMQIYCENGIKPEDNLARAVALKIVCGSKEVELYEKEVAVIYEN